jgi:hypothetical protein
MYSPTINEEAEEGRSTRRAGHACALSHESRSLIPYRTSTAPGALPACPPLGLGAAHEAMAMRAVPLLGSESPVTWAGALTQELQPDGSVRPWRLPHGDAAL